MTTSIRRWLAALVTVAAVAACSDGQPGVEVQAEASSEGEDGVAYVMAALRNQGGDYATPIRSLSFFLPNTFVRYTDTQVGPHPWHEDTGVVMVRGRVTEAVFGKAVRELPEPDYGMPRPDDAPDERYQVEVPIEEFLADQSSASWWTAHLEVAVEEVFGDVSVPGTIPVGVAFGARTDYDKARAGLLGIDNAVFVLDGGSAVLAYDPSRWAVAGNGRLIAIVHETGRLSLPAEEQGAASDLLVEVSTLDSLRAAAEAPGRLVTVERHGTIEYFRSVVGLTEEEAELLSTLSDPAPSGDGMLSTTSLG